ncbi:MAG: ABC transporter ATP-binding protein [Bulleidia sp.]|nr:ABC transporter ATP-binding protein [Erysipelotrichaceae bacterium]MDY2780012.1 ABC transporter ATP-binding protein [Bulleidia sp.]
MSLLSVQNLKKVYTSKLGTTSVTALKNVNFNVEEGEFIAIMGESGSGKTTLLNILASLDKPTAGKVILNGIETTSIKEKDLAAFRRDHLGFVFQDFNLLNTFNIKDNIFLPLVLQGKSLSMMQKRLAILASSLEIEDILLKYPYEVSGGQKQRTAIARALITSPDILLADEPTGALDSRTSEKILKIFENIEHKGQTILMVTHSAKAAAHASRVLFIRDGEVYHELYRANKKEDEFYEEIQNTLTIMERGRDFHA